jgi:hypothetical protein
MATIVNSGLFNPTIGKCYEVHFGSIAIDGKVGFCIARIKIVGKNATDWIDLDTRMALDPRIAVYVVQAYSEIQCPQ